MADFDLQLEESPKGASRFDLVPDFDLQADRAPSTGPLLSELQPEIARIAREWDVDIQPSYPGLSDADARSLNRTISDLLRREAERRMSEGRLPKIGRGTQQAAVQVLQSVTTPEGLAATAAIGAGAVFPPLMPLSLGVAGGLASKQIGTSAGVLSVPNQPAEEVTKELLLASASTLLPRAPKTAAALAKGPKGPKVAEPSPSQPAPVKPPEVLPSLPNELAIHEAVRAQDVLPGRDWVASPEFEFRKNPLAHSLVRSAVDADLSYRAQAARDVQRLTEPASKLTEEGLVRATTAMRTIQKGQTIAKTGESPLADLTPDERAFATELRDYFDDVRSVIIDAKKADLIESLPGPRQAALRAILDGETPGVAFKTNKLRAAGKKVVQDALDELAALDNWGPEDYVTNIERGSWRIVTDDGVTRAIAETRSGAYEKARKYGAEHPEVTSLTLDDSFNPGVEFPTKLSRGMYYRTISRLAKGLDETSARVQEMLREGGSPIAIKPTAKYAAPLQHRRGILKGEENIMDAIPAYAHSVRKKLVLDPVLKDAQVILPKLPPKMAKQIGDLLDDIKGRYSLADQITDHVLSPWGTKPFAFSRGVNAARGLTTELKLGYRAVTASVNRISGLQHTWAKVGTRWWREGRAFMDSPEFPALWEANKDLVGAEAQVFVEGGRGGKRIPFLPEWAQPMSMFQFAERANRPEAFASFLRYAEGELSMTRPDAVRYAIDQTRSAQFTYNLGSLPRLMRNPVGRLLFMFKPYLVKELEFVSQVVRHSDQAARYFTGFLLLGGPRAAIYMLRSLPFLGSAGLLWWLEDYVNRKAPAVSRGLPGVAAGVDVTAAVTPQLPSRPEDWMGPILADTWRLWSDVVQPAMRGERRDWSDVKDWGAKLAPALNYWSQLVESAQTEGGWITDERDRPVYQPDLADKVKLALGAKPLNQSIAEVDRRYTRFLDSVIRENRLRLIGDYLSAVERKDGATIARLDPLLADYGIDNAALRNAEKMRALPPDERLERSLLKVTREKREETRD